MAQRAMTQLALFDLPEHAICCILCYLQQDVVLQRNLDVEGVAALRCVCQSLRNAVDATMTQAVFHDFVDADELRNALIRRKGWELLAAQSVMMALALEEWLQCIGHLATSLNAGLHTVKLPQLYPDDAASTEEALASLPHLRSLNLR